MKVLVTYREISRWKNRRVSLKYLRGMRRGAIGSISVAIMAIESPRRGVDVLFPVGRDRLQNGRFLIFTTV